MLLERFDPFLAEFDRLTQRTFNADGFAHGGGLPMDVARREDELVVKVDLPGIPSDAIEIDLENRVLTIAAQRSSAWSDGDTVLLQERFDGAIKRRLRLPQWVDAERVTAEHTDGVLTVRLPLAEQAKARRISVTPAATVVDATTQGEISA